jgi:hypothetical protein
MPTIIKDVEVEVNVSLEDFEDYELLDELASRNLASENVQELIEKIYHKRRLSQNFDDELDKLIYAVLGRV